MITGKPPERAALPEDVVSLGDIAAMTGASLMTVRTWTHRYDHFPAPWRLGPSGEPNLYLRAEVERWLQRTARALPAVVAGGV